MWNWITDPSETVLVDVNTGDGNVSYWVKKTPKSWAVVIESWVLVCGINMDGLLNGGMHVCPWYAPRSIGDEYMKGSIDTPSVVGAPPLIHPTPVGDAR
jgi:hypothetical protein